MSKPIPRHSYTIKLHDNDAVKAALHALKDHTRTLYPDAVVDAAKSPDHPLHRYFEWDPEKAARAYNVSQACELIESVTNTVGVTSTGSKLRLVNR